MNLKDNPAYQVAFRSTVHSLDLYIPVTPSDYHTSRYLAAGAQDIFSSAGATKDFLKKITDTIIKWSNDDAVKTPTFRSDVAVLMQNIQYRLKYPVDELCAIRMGAVFCFMEDEDPNETKDFWTQRKMDLALRNFEKGIAADPELYTFF